MFSAEEGVIRTHCKQAEGMRCYYLYGKNTYLLRYYAGKLIERAVGDSASPFSTVYFDLEEQSMEQLAEAVWSAPFFGGNKCVVVRRFSPSDLSTKETERLKSLLNDIPEYTTLVFLGSDMGGKKAALKKGFPSWVDKVGAVFELIDRDRAGLIKFLQALAIKGGCTIHTSSCALLLDRTSTDMQLLSQEMHKLCAYVGKGGEIQSQHIQLLCAEKVEYSVFDLSRCILRQDAQGALERLRSLREQREEPVAVLAALSAVFVDLYRAKIAAIARKPQQQVAEDFGYKGQEFRVRNAFRDSERFSVTHLRRCLCLLMDTDQNLKTSGADGFSLLQQLVLQMLRVLSNLPSPS